MSDQDSEGRSTKTAGGWDASGMPNREPTVDAFARGG
jgi:hypothetical protein